MTRKKYKKLKEELEANNPPGDWEKYLLGRLREAVTDQQCKPKEIIDFIRQEIDQAKKEGHEEGMKENVLVINSKMAKEISEKSEWKFMVDRIKDTAKQKTIAEIEDLIVQEILIAQSEGQPTSRLTSLAVSVKKLK